YHADRRSRILLLERERRPRLAPAALQSEYVRRVPAGLGVLAGLPPHPRLPRGLHRRFHHVREVLDHDDEYGPRGRREANRVERNANSRIPTGSADLAAGAGSVHPGRRGGFWGLGGGRRGRRRPGPAGGARRGGGRTPGRRGRETCPFIDWPGRADLADEYHER